jgi:hypothetical protein
MNGAGGFLTMRIFIGPDCRKERHIPMSSARLMYR